MGLLTPLAVRIGALSWMPKLLPQVVTVDTTLQRVTRGRLSLLDVAGWLIPGSYFGGPKMPLWVGNLRAIETAETTIGGRTTTVRWRELEGAERARMWQVMLRAWPNYAKYEARTERVIPVFLLERA